MNELQRKKLTELKAANNEHVKTMQRENNLLLQECLEVLESYRIISDETELAEIMRLVNDKNAVERSDFEVLTLQPERLYYVVWDNAQTPIIECSGKDILANWDDVAAVAFYTCIVDKEMQYAVLIKG